MPVASRSRSWWTRPSSAWPTRPAELAHDVLERGIFLTGGSGLLRGLDMRLSGECEVPVHMTEHPLQTVVLGAGRLLEYMPDYRSAFVAASKWA